MSNAKTDFFTRRRVFVGDIHNHCGISYGHGPLEDALYNAALQLDFVAVTGHAGWPDMGDQPMPAAVTEYHQQGFKKLRANWDHYLRVVEEADDPGSFVTFFSYEFHSFRYGDRTIVTPVAPRAPNTPSDPEALALLLSSHDAGAAQALLLPHHIGYEKGFRGVDWDSVTDAASPLVEIFSMHGCAESDEDAQFPYLHTMGPLSGTHTMQAGLAQGHHFGVTASTDHHSAHPGSYGYGRTAVWAQELTRESIWTALLERRTYALTGDRMEITFTVAGAPMGSRAAVPPGPRRIEATVRGGGALDRLELLKNNRVIYREVFSREEAKLPASGLVYLEFGWGQRGENVSWDITIELREGVLSGFEPRLRGYDVVDPLETPDHRTRFSSLQRVSPGVVRLQTMTFGNRTTSTRQTQGIALDVEATAESTLVVSTRGRSFSVSIAEILENSRTFYTGGFTSPAIRVHRFVPESERNAALQIDDAQVPRGQATDVASPTEEDWYYLRVFQRNGHAAWTSPVWIGVPPAGST